MDGCSRQDGWRSGCSRYYGMSFFLGVIEGLFERGKGGGGSEEEMRWKNRQMCRYFGIGRLLLMLMSWG